MSEFLLNDSDLQQTINTSRVFMSMSDSESYKTQKRMAKKFGLNGRQFKKGFDWNQNLLEQVDNRSQILDVVSLSYSPGRSMFRSIDRSSPIFSVTSMSNEPEDEEQCKYLAQLRLAGLLAGLNEVELCAVKDSILRNNQYSGLEVTSKRIFTGKRGFTPTFVRIKQASLLLGPSSDEFDKQRRAEADLSTFLHTSEKELVTIKF